MSTPWIMVALITGVLLGAFYYGGLWITVRRLSVARVPALVLFISFVVRVAIVLLGFYLVSGGRWERIVACLFGVLIARVLSIRLLGEAAQIAGQSSSSSANAERMTQ